MEIFYVFLGFFWIVGCGVWGYQLGSAKNNGGGGALLGALFGPLGLFLAYAIDGRPGCPACGGRLNGTPATCQFCHRDLVWKADPSTGSSSASLAKPDDRAAKSQICPECGGILPGQFAKCTHCTSDLGWVEGNPCRKEDEVRLRELAQERKQAEADRIAREQRAEEERRERERSVAEAAKRAEEEHRERERQEAEARQRQALLEADSRLPERCPKCQAKRVRAFLLLGALTESQRAYVERKFWRDVRAYVATKKCAACRRRQRFAIALAVFAGVFLASIVVYVLTFRTFQ